MITCIRRIFALYLNRDSIMTWNELKRVAVKNGWQLFRHGASHDVYVKSGMKGQIYIERHWNKEIKPGLQKRLLKQILDESTGNN